MAAGRFRQDLYYRLSAFSVELPPLRSCPEDVCFLIDRLMEKIPQKYGVRPGACPARAFGKLLAYNWPGNIRSWKTYWRTPWPSPSRSLSMPSTSTWRAQRPPRSRWKERLKREERQILRQTLAQCGGSP